MGDLITGAERASPVSGKSSAKYNGSGFKRAASPMFKTGYKLGENMVAGRMYVGLKNSGPRMGGNIYVLGRTIVRGVLRTPGRLLDGIKIAMVLLDTFSQHIDAQYTSSFQCGGSPTFASGLANSFNCVSPKVVAKSAINQSTNARTVTVWQYLGEYINTTSIYAKPVATYTKPAGFPNASVDITQNRRIIPQTASSIPWPEIGQPMANAPDFSLPQSAFDQGQQTETSYNPGNWAGTDYGVGTITPVPLPGTQVITPTPTPPVVKPGDPGPSTPSGRRGGRKEVKFAGSKIMLRLMRLALATGEGLDRLDAIVDAIPKKDLKECRRKARERYYRNKREGKYWGTVNWQMMPHEQAQCLYDNLEKLDLNHVFYNLVKNEIEDLWVGYQYGAIDKGLQISRRHGGPLSTKNPAEAIPMDDVLPLPDFDQDRDFWQQVEDYLEGRERNA